jgi:hypothetical protein
MEANDLLHAPATLTLVNGVLCTCWTGDWLGHRADRGMQPLSGPYSGRGFPAYVHEPCL